MPLSSHSSAFEDILPLAPLQQGLLFHALYHREGLDLYISQLVLRLDGTIDPLRLKRAATALIQRHANLRAGFVHEDVPQPVQVIVRDVAVPWSEQDLSAAEAEERERRFTRWLDDDRAQRFALMPPPLLRWALIRFAESDHRLVLTYHHLLLDGWSLPVFVRELIALYETQGDTASLPPAPPYRDYLAWVAGQDTDAAASAWRDALAGLEQGTCIAPAKRGPMNLLPQDVLFEVSEPLTAALVDRAATHRITLNTVIQVTWAALLAKLTHSDDVVFGATVAGRPPGLQGADRMIGLFINTVPVRVRLRPWDSVAQVLQNLQATQADLLSACHLPLADIQRAAGLANLFDTLLVFDNYPVAPALADRHGARLRIAGASGRDAAHYPLTLIVVPGRRLRLRLTYRPELLDRAWVERVGRWLLDLLDAMAIADTAVPIARLTLDRAAEPREILPARYPETCAVVLLPALFEAQVRRTPDAIAVRGGDRDLTYRDLNERANRLGRVLMARDVGPGRYAVIAMPCSVDTVVALLAVLKSGGAYVPIDPSAPPSRVAALLADVKPTVVVSVRSVAAQLPIGDYVALDDPALEDVLRESSDCDVTDSERHVRLAPQHPAYVIHTSGSTGRPKGVVVPHAALSHYVRWAGAKYVSRDGAGVPVNTPVVFDATVTSLWLPLLDGRAIFLLPGERELDALADLMRGGTPLSLVKMTPSHLQALSELLSPHLKELRVQRFVVGGESLRGATAAFWSARVPELRIVNEYGPTEATVGCCTHEIEAEAEYADSVPIGSASPGTQLYVLGHALDRVGAGLTGELYIAGSQLALGYLHAASLTAQRFVANPFGPPGTRLYRTGDLARTRSDGALECLGRVDDQVKVNGIRIELGEIEAALLGVDGVLRAAAAVRYDGGRARLIGYVVPESGAQIDPEVVRRRLDDRLPAAMVPSAIVPLDTLPLTINGKVDRRALPEPGVTVAHTWRAPQMPEDEILCGVMAEVLGRQYVGVDDDFFALGGDSLTAAALAGRISAVFGVEVEISEIFDAPKIVDLRAVIDAARQTSRPPLHPMPRPDAVPLSFAQQRIWFLERLHERSTIHNVPLALRLRGRLDVEALIAALQDVVSRHETLRSVVMERDGIPTQRALADARLSCALESVARDVLDAAMRTFVLHPFSLTAEIPLRAKLYRVAEQDYVLLVVVHHIATDGWSIGPFLSDLAQAYLARASGSAPAWSPLPIQYTDYVLWQRQMLGSEQDGSSAFAKQMTYWRTALADLPEELQLPYDHPRPTADGAQGAQIPLQISRSVHAALVRLGRECHASVFMVLQAVLAAWLTRLGAGSDIPLGAPIAGRTAPATEGLVGLFVNTLVLRTDTGGNPTFRELVTRARTTALAAYAHQDVPFERLVDVLQPSRSLARHPLFQVALVANTTPQPTAVLPDLRITSQPMCSDGAKFDLGITVWERREQDGTPEGVTGHLEYRSDLFESSTAERLAFCLGRVLETMASNPDEQIGVVDILSETERAVLAAEWNTPPVPVPWSTVVAAIRERMAGVPDAIAVVSDGHHVTFGALRRQVDAIACWLVDRGAGPDRIVTVLTERSLDMVIALLGVLSAGAAYLPLDPEWPDERITRIVADAAPVLAVSTQHLAARLPAGLETAVVGASSPAIEDFRRVEWPCEGGGNLAYVIYTSGSTGRPKGVMNTHAGLINRLWWMQNAYGIDRTERVLQKTPYTFDVSVWEFFLPLMAGATLIVLPPGEHRDPAAVVRTILREEITTLHFVPVMLRPFLQTPGSDRCRSVRRIVCSGEALVADLVPMLVNRMPGTELHNLYGPTEAAIDVTAWACHSEAGGGPPPIGRAIANTRVYVLDGALQPVPTGVVGELYIAGCQLARGYIGQRDLTAARFTADPFGRPGARMYRTGDLVRRRADGAIVYLGRIDDQVKLRGMRVELGEIEAAVRTVPGVRDAVVVMRQDTSGQPGRLVTYVVAEDTRLEASAVRALLHHQLPDYMVPDVVLLDRLPLTASGKVDRRALPAAAAPRQTAYRAPRTEAERVLCSVAAELLRVPQVGLDDNFFAIGGDSIVAIQLVSRAARAGLRLAPRDVFLHPVIERMAAAAGESAPVAIQDDGAVGDVPLTPIMHALTPTLESVGRFVQAQWLYTPVGTALPELAAALQTVIDHHDVLRLRVTAAPDDGTWRLSVRGSDEVTAAECLRRVELRGLDAAAREHRIQEEASSALDRVSPQHGHIVQAVWFDDGSERRGLLLVVVHHLAIDGVSWRILVPDIEAAWTSVRRGIRADLGPKGTSFRHWSRRLAEHARGMSQGETCAYWQRTAAGNVQIGTRPLDPRRDTDAAARILTRTLSAPVTDAVLSRVPAAFHADVNAVMLAALGFAFAKWPSTSGTQVDPTLVLAMEVHGRSHPFGDIDITRTVGWFTSEVPIRLDLRAMPAEPASAQVTVQHAIDDLTKQSRRAAEDGLDYGMLRYLNAETAAGLAISPTPQFCFNYLGRLALDDRLHRDWGIVAPSPAIHGTASPHRSLRHVLGLTAVTLDYAEGPRLRASWTWAPALLSEASVQALADLWFVELERLVDLAPLAADAGVDPPALAPLMDLTDDDLDTIARDFQSS